MITIAELGVDQLIVDEMQQFRKLLATNQTTLKGVDPDGLQRAWDLYVKVRFIDTTVNICLARRWCGAAWSPPTGAGRPRSPQEGPARPERPQESGAAARGRSLWAPGGEPRLQIAIPFGRSQPARPWRPN